MNSEKRVLSIQSHVVFGHVGNKSATFPLQVLGFEVDAINSVQFCCHTGYEVVQGQVLDAKDLETLYGGLKSNQLNQSYSHVLTGYIGSLSFLEKVHEAIVDVKKQNPGITYVCDPVMGDNGRMYVPEDLLPFYTEKIIPLADVITPNQYEAQLLTGIEINTEEDAIRAMDVLHKRGISIVVLSSTELGTSGHLVALGSKVTDAGMQRVRYKIPKFPVSFTGTGDLFAALLLAWLDKSDNDLKTSVEKVLATMQNILYRTYEYAKQKGISPATLELKLIQSKRDIEEPDQEQLQKQCDTMCAYM
ncbi:Pyridoxal kinase [Halotydeus destructor]|nr:Pyridoxal kinase [Halotydeus destructor]